MRPRLTAAALLLAVSAACGGSDPTGPTGQLPNGTFRMQVDGSHFNAIAATVIVTGANNIISIGAANAASSGFGMAWIDAGEDTYTVGVTQASIGVNATYSLTGGNSWHASTTNGSGTIIVTTRTATRVAGTFQFAMVPQTGNGATGNKQITQGEFDLTLTP